ncbi:MAG: glycosyltransferase [Thiohalocapsa sp. PB-PSB1]|nr:MAG: hypothetical protein N838_14105 [Thiohalocapsa sp. PB-PSB1]QQO55474.1 MAG: glycosyltransferase [Thiohalocapsa sp. PB-PSB1]HCS90392.1 hypothetical protein [Chromatiaceae bacterium]
MKVLIVTHGPYLNADAVVSGNSVRAYYLARGLRAYGIDVVYASPADLERLQPPGEPADPGIRVVNYADTAALQALILREAPTVLYVGYWELLAEIPDPPGMPVVVDVVAPRILETLYQEERVAEDEIRRTLALYRRADRFVCGTERQKHLLLPWLLLAGFDCRYDVPVDVIPLSTEPGQPHSLVDSAVGLRFVSGGVVWPWRRTETWFDALVRCLHADAGNGDRFMLFEGKYVYNPAQQMPKRSPVEQAWPESIIERLQLLPYGEMARLLQTQCDIGVELADENTERAYSHSFRSTEFLRCGLPVIANDYLELAGPIRDYDAGWVISSPQEIPDIVAELRADPDSLVRKSEHAIRLVDDCFAFDKTIRPLVDFVRAPAILVKRSPLLSLDASAPAEQCISTEDDSVPRPATSDDAESRAMAEAILPVSPSGTERALRRAKAAALRWAVTMSTGLLGLVGRATRVRPPGKRLVIVTRSDIVPADHGAAVKIDRTAWGLSHHLDMVYVVTDDREQYYAYRAGTRTEHRYPRWLASLGPDRQQVRERLTNIGVPVSDAFLYEPLTDWSFIARTLYLGHRSGASVFQAEFPAYARACAWTQKLLGGSTLLVEHNVEHQRLENQFPDMPEAARTLLRSTEVQLCNRVDAVVVVSEPDGARLRVDGVDAEKIHLIPHGVDLEAFDAAVPADVRGRFGIDDDTVLLVYHGIYLYPPNLEAMRIMANQILPRLEGRGVKAKVLAIGRNPPDEPLHPDIIFTGSVEQIAPYLMAADIAVVPLVRGGGTRMKILDYFAARIPVVTTSKGIEGIPATPGKEAAIADDWTDFSAAIQSLADDRGAAADMGAAGRRLVEPLGWRDIACRYLDLV